MLLGLTGAKPRILFWLGRMRLHGEEKKSKIIPRDMGDDSTTDNPADLQQRKDVSPGAVRLGNFINYYQFHPPEDRIKQLPTDVWLETPGPKIVCLDVGCNTGDLTQEVFQHVKAIIQKSADVNVEQKECFILGVDIDPALILRAEQSNKFRNYITFKALDVMTSESKTTVNDYLGEHCKGRFDAIFCFSVTMWIHLNHGDYGLKKFLHQMCDMSELLIIEPQPWKCYLSAVRRLKRCNESFPNLTELKMNRKVDDNIEDIIQNKHKFMKIYESCPNSWGRKIVIFKRTTK